MCARASDHCANLCEAKGARTLRAPSSSYQAAGGQVAFLDPSRPYTARSGIPESCRSSVTPLALIPETDRLESSQDGRRHLPTRCPLSRNDQLPLSDGHGRRPALMGRKRNGALENRDRGKPPFAQDRSDQPISSRFARSDAAEFRQELPSRPGSMVGFVSIQDTRPSTALLAFDIGPSSSAGQCAAACGEPIRPGGRHRRSPVSGRSRMSVASGRDSPRQSPARRRHAPRVGVALRKHRATAAPPPASHAKAVS
jgi:hypothetical protein